MSGVRTVSARAPRLRLPRVPPRALLALALTAGLLAGGWWWLRDSPLVEVDDVTIVGVSSSDEGRIRAALTDEAREMTTLHVRTDVLRRAVAEFPSVASLRTKADFPH